MPGETLINAIKLANSFEIFHNGINYKVSPHVMIKLSIDLNHNPDIIKDIQHITFENLTCLNIGGNRIESIEGLSRIRMPKLK